MNEIDFSQFPEISTKRLCLKQPNEEDAADLFEIRSNASVNKFLDRKHAESIDEVKMFIRTLNENFKRGASILWTISLKGNKKIAGTICLWNWEKEKLKAEIGFELLPEFQGRGIMSEAIPEVLKFGKEIMKLKRVEGFTRKLNLKSRKIMEKFGFERDVKLEKKLSDVNPEFEDSVIYVLEF